MTGMSWLYTHTLYSLVYVIKIRRIHPVSPFTLLSRLGPPLEKDFQSFCTHKQIRNDFCWIYIVENIR